MHLKLKGRHYAVYLLIPPCIKYSSFKFLILKMWRFCCPCQVVVRKDEILSVNKLFFWKIKENLESWDIIIICPCPKPSALPSARGLVLRAPLLSCTYCGQEGIQEAARKDTACAKGSAEMQSCSREVLLHPTKLFNEVDIGRIFCKAKEGDWKDRQASLRT